MHETHASVGMCSHTFMQCAPVVSRRILVTQCLGHEYQHAQVHSSVELLVSTTFHDCLIAGDTVSRRAHNNWWSAALEMTVGNDSRFNDMQAQRIQMRLYRHLELQTDQRESLAARWHSWCRRRRNLDKQLTAALRKLQNLLAPAEVIHSAALRIVSAVLDILHS